MRLSHLMIKSYQMIDVSRIKKSLNSLTFFGHNSVGQK